MSNTQPPAQFDWATELSDAQGHVTLSKQEAKEIGARLRSMGAKLKTYEDLGGAGSDVQILRMGYAAARLEIESLQSQLHAAKQINAAQFTLLAASIPGAALRPPHGQAPAGAYKDSTPDLHVGDSSFESWYADYVKEGTKGLKQHCRDAYAAGMGDPLVRAAPAAVAGPSEFPHEQMDVIALARYKVMPSHESMFHRHAVVAGDGSQQLYIGREVECENMARKFAGAFLDGAFAFHSMLAAAPTTQPAPQQEAQEPVALLSDDVVRDAVRYRWLREGNDAKHGAAWHVAVNLYGCEWDAAIDAARAVQEGK